ncbi:molybdopterin cofactor-binding domain-containing protein [Nisaea sp.]|uniref:molybdopterin cofactor-binding domain-containing protein n=1 Tax=Nisaea sp. TaxID=2024842 RepID=UPI0032651B77
MTDTTSGSLEIFRQAGTVRETFIRIDASGQVTAYNGHVDLGTGIEVALGQIVAEELNVPLDWVRVVLGNTDEVPDQGPTIASETMQITAIPLRKAAAQAYRQLLRLGALRLNAPENAVTSTDGAVHWQAQSIGYGALIAGQEIAQPLDLETPVKDPTQYEIVGTSAPRRDMIEKLTGQQLYVHDLHIEGMVHGHVIRPPYAGRDTGDFIGNSLIDYDPASVTGMDGLIDVVRVGDFLGVVAERPEQAQRIAEALDVTWRQPPPLPDLGDLVNSLKSHPSTPRALDRSGDFETGIAESAKTLSRTYVWPYHEHGSIGPSCAVADWNEATPVVWSGTQSPHLLRADLAMLVALPAETIEVRRYQVAGCFGRNCADDVCGDALLLSRATGKPVRVQLTRAQEHLWEPKGAAQIMAVEGGMTAANELHAYALDTWYPSNRGPNLALLLTGVISGEPRPADMGDRTSIPPYRVPHKKITVHDMAPIVRAAYIRGVSALPNTFAHESFIDEMAFEASEDPVAFRLRHMNDPREAELVRRTAEAAGWDQREGPRFRREGRMAFGQGFAFATYVHGTFPGVAAASAAWIVDVSVDLDSGVVTLHRVFVGQDQGLAVNPDGVRQQIHGNVIQTAGRVLTEQVTFDEITPTPKSWATYPIQTFPEVPEIQTLIVSRPEDPPLGVGESAAVPSAAAIANAIFDATGVRMREVPFTPEAMRKALGNTDGPLRLQGQPESNDNGRRGKILGWAGAVAGALTLGAISLPLHSPIPPSPAPKAGTFSAETLERGRQVFALGDCAICHTADGDLTNAGGRAMETPFGTVWTTNLTPDPETGLGNWSYEAFSRAMRKGISSDGSHLYPAFPYTSFAKIGEEDMFALYAHLQTLEPVKSETPTAQMVAPVNIRSGMALWNAAFHDTAPFQPDPAASEVWNRGKYLVEAAGHCGACHAPRNLLGAEKPLMTGTMVDGWFAPALQGVEAGARGWTEDSLFSYMRTGLSDHAAAAGPMAEVVSSMTALPDDDIRAMSVYLASLIPPAAAPAVHETPPSLAPDATHRIFESACAVCHDPAMPDLVTAARVPLTASAVLRAPTPEAFRSLLDQGIEAPVNLDLRDMPSFREEFTPAQRDALAAYMRTRFAPDLPAW